MSPRAILTDIEGTTTDIAFVHEVLFPYAREHLADFVHARAGQPAVAAALVEARAAMDAPAADLPAVIGQLQAWLDEDRKITPLKTLQGLLWQGGYERGELRAHLYPDVAPALRRWQAAGHTLAVYSSGSVAAQRLLFGHTEAGDLTGLFSAWFDTHIGGKREAASYRHIVAELALPAGAVLFLSDVAAELDAAAAAGLATCQLVRPGTVPAARHPHATDFDAVSRRWEIA
ncbi:MAG TPA: acireductone synthase [Gammaproteobacteria bacterium]|nr:acireductone synthase [Gammaproteobacteria bacterium]